MKRLAIALFVLSFLVYMTSYQRIVKGDTTGARILPFLILSGRGIYFDDVASLYPELPYFFFRRDGHVLSGYPLIPGIIALPVAIPFWAYLVLIGHTSPVEFVRISPIVEKISSALVAALSVSLFFILMVSLTKKRKTSALLALVFGFATPTFSVSSQYLWQHGIANIFLLLSLLLLIRRNYAFSLIIGLLAASTRFSFLFFYGLLWLSILWLDKRRWLEYLSLGVTLFIVYFFINWLLWGRLFGTGVTPINDFTLTNALGGTAGVLFSPARGIIFYTPWFFLSFLTLFGWPQIRKYPPTQRAILVVSFLFFIWTIVIHGAWGSWWGGWGWGDRYLTDASVGVTILLYYTLLWNRRRIWLGLAAILVLYSLGTQILGVYFYPRGQWDNYPNNVEENLGRLWDWSDNPIVRHLAIGPELSGLYQLGYTLSGYTPRAYQGIERSCRLSLKNKGNRFGYKAAELLFSNASSVDWLTAGKNLLHLRQVYLEDNDLGFESPIPSQQLPSIVRSGESVLVRVVLIPPRDNLGPVLIAPVQEGVAWWDRYCTLVISL